VAFGNNGPAWIGLASFSKTGTTVYFDGKAFKRGQGISGNHYDIETGDEYWISGIKKDMTDRHWAGGGLIHIERRILDEYLLLIDKQNLDPNKYSIVDVDTNSSVERVNMLENRPVNSAGFSYSLIFKEAKNLNDAELDYVIKHLEYEMNSAHKNTRKMYRAKLEVFENESQKRKA
jgi:hypothetical protein